MSVEVIITEDDPCVCGWLCCLWERRVGALPSVSLVGADEEDMPHPVLVPVILARVRV